MQIEASVIHIDGSDNADFIIHQIALRMDEARRVLIDSHACPNQCFVIGACQRIHDFLIRNSRRYDAHINTAHGCAAECPLHLVVNGKVWRKDVDISLRL